MKIVKKVITILTIIVLAAGLIPPVKSEAATLPRLNVASRTLYLGTSSVSKTKPTYTIKIENLPDSYSVSWSSEDDDIFTVTKKSGGKATLTAVSIGSANVHCVLKDTKLNKTYSLSAKVTVKKNCSSVSLSPAGNAELKVGQTLQLTGTMYDEKGNKVTKGKGTTDIMKWESSNPSVATVTSKGYVTAVSTGTADITCYTLQASTGTYSVRKYATAVKTMTVTVKASGIVSLRQTKLNELVAVFGEDFSKKITKDNIILTAGTVPVSVKDIVFDSTGRQAVITTYNELTDGVNYTLTTGDTSAACTATKGEPVRVEVYTDFGDNKVIAGTTTTLRFRFYNASGVDITPGPLTSSEYQTYAARVSCVAESIFGSWYVFDKSAYIATAGQSVNIVVTYLNGLTSFKSTATLIAVTEASTITFDKIAVVKSDVLGENIDWTKTSDVLSLTDTTGYKLVARLKKPNGEYIYSTDANSKVIFSIESPKSIFLSESGVLYPYAEGTDYVAVKYGDLRSSAVVIGGQQVSVGPARKPSNVLMLDENGTAVTSVDLSSVYDVGATNLTLLIYDQYGEVIPLIGGVTVASLTGSTMCPYPSLSYNVDGSVNISVNGAGFGTNAGSSYQYKITYTGANASKIEAYFSITVYQPNTTIPSTYKAEVKGNMDLSVTEANITSFPVTLSVDLIEMKGNVKYAKYSALYSNAETCPAGYYYYKIICPNGSQLTTGLNGNSINVITEAGGVISKLATGTYGVTIYKRGTGSNPDVPVTGTSFVLKDSQSKVSIVRKTSTTSRTITTTISADEKAAIFAECYDVTIGGKKVSASDITVNDDGLIYQGLMFVPSITITERVKIGQNTYFIQHKVSVNEQIKSSAY